MSYKIVKNKDYLHKKTEPVATIEEGEAIAKQLIEALDELSNGLGLSANQIGINKSVSVVRARKDAQPIILMNPTIVEASKEKLIFTEGCLSLPGKLVNTIRSLKVTVSTLNHANPLPFGPDTTPVTQESVRSDYGLLEAICVQHEIDHTNGILMTDDGVKFVQKVEKMVKHGRNDKVVVEKDGETQYIKYKKALELIEQGWKII
jgi:peptide deformylase